VAVDCRGGSGDLAENRRLVTGSVGLLSDALEAVVNLVAAVTAPAMLRWAASPPDRRHMSEHD
jgi:divalent metal cation (Fe/Co/Zn/Cd) transporter